MKKNLLYFLILHCIPIGAQNFADLLQQHAIDIKSDAVLYNIKGYKCVMMGEMHGTTEAAAFLERLITLSSKQGNKIMVGLEIPAGDMKAFVKRPTNKNLKKTKFFREGYGDGRNSAAWFNLIDHCKELKNVTFCFFDINPDEKVVDRDSQMYRHLVRAYRMDTTRMVFTLSGNIHNKTAPFRGNKTLGCYLVNYFSSDKVMSINHVHGPGTMYNKTSEGLSNRKLAGQTGIFTKYTTLENYFLPLLPTDFMTDYTAILYTRSITASMGGSKQGK